MTTREAHWQDVYARKRADEVSWFQEAPVPSLDLIESTGVGTGAAIVDIGGGASRLVDALVARGFRNVTVLDLSRTALLTAKQRLGKAAQDVRWIEADVTRWEPASKSIDVWHDRAAFHFLTERADQDAYMERLRRGIRSGGHAIIGTFALDGPKMCSGLPVQQHDTASLARLLGPQVKLINERRHEHRTPAGATQAFQFSVFQFE